MPNQESYGQWGHDPSEVPGKILRSSPDSHRFHCALCTSSPSVRGAPVHGERSVRKNRDARPPASASKSFTCWLTSRGEPCKFRATPTSSRFDGAP